MLALVKRRNCGRTFLTCSVAFASECRPRADFDGHLHRSLEALGSQSLYRAAQELMHRGVISHIHVFEDTLCGGCPCDVIASART